MTLRFAGKLKSRYMGKIERADGGWPVRFFYFIIFLHALASSSRVLHGAIWHREAMVWMLDT